MSTTTTPLPPIGQIGEADHATVVTYLQGLAQEAGAPLAAWTRLVDENRKFFHYGDVDEPVDGEVRVNDIQNDVIAITDLQTKEPAHPTLEPVETGEPAECYWAGPQGVGIGLGLDANQVAEWLDDAGELRPPLPLDEERADALRDAIAAGGMPTGQVDPMTGQPRLQRVKETWLAEVSDQTVADTYQTVFDVYWRRSQVDLWNRVNLLKNNVQGWAWGLLEFNAGGQRFDLRHLSVKQVLVDPTVMDIADAAYAGINVAMDANEAKALYPHLADDIDAAAQIGAPARFDASTSYGGAFDDVNFQRGMVAFSVWWLRNWACPHTPEQALAMGLVEQREVSVGGEQEHGDGIGDRDEPAAGFDDHLLDDGAGPADEEPRPGPGTDGADGADGDGEGAREAGPVEGGDAGRGALGVGEEDGAGDDGAPRGDGAAVGAEGGEAAGGGLEGLPPQPPTRVGFFLAGTDEEVTPLTVAEDGIDAPHPKWPTYPCIRQITVIAGVAVVDDRPCPRGDIPLLHNVCIPVLDRPFGIGEPFRLKTLQKARSRALGAIVDHCEYFRHPVGAMPASVAKALREQYGDAYIRPGISLEVDDDLWARTGGKVDMFYEPPQTPPALIDLVAMLKGETSDQSGNTDVLKGQTPGGGVTAASAIGLLQQAGSSLIGFKATRTADMVQRQGELMLHDLVAFLELDDVYRVVSRYPRHVLAAIIERAKRIEWDVSVEVSVGNGAMRAQKKQEAMDKKKAGLISLETAQERVGEDPRLEKRRMGQEAKELAQAQAAAMAGAAPPAA